MSDDKPRQKGATNPSPQQKTRRTLHEMRQDDLWPRPRQLLLTRSEEVSPHHICSLQARFGKTFEEAAQMVYAASCGNLVCLGEYTPEVIETKVLWTQQTLLELKQPLMSFAYAS
jgi:hypothetical protein